jgi:AcrR family transcriptional regulator
MAGRPYTDAPGRRPQAGGSAGGGGTPPRRGETKQQLIGAALATLRDQGFAAASARQIAATGGLNQALIFYHFGSVQALLLAALDEVSRRRTLAYAGRLRSAGSLAELAALAREIYAEDLENGYVKVLAEMVAGSVSDPELGAAVVARIEPWIGMVEEKLAEVLAGSVLESLVPARESAFAIVALYLGLDLLSHLAGDQAGGDALLTLAERYAPLAEMLLASARRRR